MKLALPFLLAASSVGCSQPGMEQAPLTDRFEEAIHRNEEIVFVDSSNLGASMDGSILSLHFFPDSRVHLYTWGNGFSNYPGTYAFTEDHGIELFLEDQSWPLLRLSGEVDSFVLERQDGRRSLTRSHIHTDQEGLRTRIDDADIYPEARSLIFPLTQRIEVEKQDATEKSAPLSEPE